MIKILIVDDHALIREGLKRIFGETSDLCVAGEASDSQTALSKISEQHFDIVILDLSLPGRSGLDTLKQLKCLKPDLPVLVLSIYPESQYGIRVLKAGAAGYLTKDSSPETLIQSIRKITSGGKVVTDTLAEKLVAQLNHPPEQPLHETLSDREYQVLLAIANGKTAKAISADLNLSVKTISTYRTRLLQKMKLKNNTEIICYAVRHGLVK